MIGGPDVSRGEIVRILAALLPASVLLAAGGARAASVTEVNTEKKTVTVELEGDETFEKDSEVCFFDDTEKEIACGKVTKVKGTAVTVKVTAAKKLKKVTEGMAAKPKGDAAAADEEATPKKGKKGAAAKKGKDKSKGKNPLRIIGIYNPALSSPFVYKKLAYAAPSSTTPETLWSQDKTVGTAMKDNPLSLTMQVAIPLGNFSIAPGVRYRSYKPSLIDADYILNRENPFVRTEMSATSFGLIVDFMYYRGALMPDLIFADLTGGLDVDNSTVSLTAKKEDDSGQAAAATGDIAKATSKLTVVSLRVGAGVEAMVLKLIGVRLGLNLMVPLLETGATFSGEISDEESRGQEDPGEDLKKALDHKKNSMAIEISFGGVLAF